MPKRPTLILAIETSCDETAAAVLSVEPSPGPSPRGRGRETQFPNIKALSSVVKSQIKLHSKMGGVVPEAAARAHIKNILPVVEQSLQNAFRTLLLGRTKVYENILSKFDYIAVTQGPGLMPSLMVGVEFAKALSLATGKPLVPVNHMLGHLYSPFAQMSNVKCSSSAKATADRQMSNIFPMVSLIVSGGHTMLVLQKNLYDYKVIGQTVDDAAGEAFDKVAKLLGLPYPGGPEVSKLAERGDSSAITFPRPMIHSKDYNFSFSGLKTAVLYFVKDKGLKISAKGGPAFGGKDKTFVANVCAAFQEAAIDVLVTKTLRAAKQFKAKSVSISGGVSANKALCKELNVKCQMSNVQFFAPSKNLSTDNAEMIGMAAAVMLQQKKKFPPVTKIQANPNLSL